MYASNYAGCGCTALTPSYAGPSFVPSRPGGYGVEKPDQDERTGGEKALIIVLGLLALYGIHRAAGGFTPPPAYKASHSTAPPRKYHLPR